MRPHFWKSSFSTIIFYQFQAVSKSTLFLSLFSVILLVQPADAQVKPSCDAEWILGTTVEATLMERVPTAAGVGVHATRMSSEGWGIRLAVRRDAVIQRDISEAYRSLSDPKASEWSDQRRLNITAGLVWRPLSAPSGQWGHAVQVHAGPTLQMQRGEQLRYLGVLEGGLESAIGPSELQADNTYLDRTREGQSLLLLTEDTNRTNVGGTLGVEYGITYRSITVHLSLMGRALTNIDGATFGAGGGLSYRL